MHKSKSRIVEIYSVASGHSFLSFTTLSASSKKLGSFPIKELTWKESRKKRTQIGLKFRGLMCPERFFCSEKSCLFQSVKLSLAKHLYGFENVWEAQVFHTLIWFILLLQNRVSLVQCRVRSLSKTCPTHYGAKIFYFLGVIIGVFICHPNG